MDNLFAGFENLNSDTPTKPAYVPQDFDTKTHNNDVNSFSKSMDDIMTSGLENVGKTNDGKGSEITYADRSQTDIYRFQKDFDPVGFNPSDSLNYDKFLNRETFGSALSKGLDSFSHKFGGTFKDYWKDYGRMTEAITSWDWSKMMPDEDQMLKQYYEDQIDMNKNFVFVKPEDEDAIFNKRFLSEFVGNAGFAMGTFSALSMEIAGDILLTAATGGSGAISFGATWARLTGKAAAKAAAKEGAEQALTKGFMIDDLFKGFASTSGKSVDDFAVMANAAKVKNAVAPIANRTASATEELLGTQFGIFSRIFDISKSKSVTEIAANFGRALPVVGAGFSSIEKIAAGAKAGLSGSELAGMGLQGIRRMAQELNMSSTEASFEAVTSYGDVLNTLVDDYRAKHGEAPSPYQIDEMKSLAIHAASGNYNTNMGVLLATNKLQFGNLFNKFAPANRVMRELTESTDTNFLTAMNKNLVQVYDKGKWGTVSVLGKVVKDFGKKEAAYQMGKSFMKNFGKFELTEGIQENIQEMSGAAWKNYYVSKYDSTGVTLSNAFELGLEEQFTKQGFKTFLMGALTGSIISGPTKAINMSLDSLREGVDSMTYSGEKGKRPSVLAKEQLSKDLELLNTHLKDMTGAGMKEKTFNFNAQMNAAMDMADAASQGKEYEFQNAKDDAFLAAVAVAKKTGSIKALQQAIKNMGDNMTEEEFKIAFNIELKETKYKSPKEFTESISTKIEEYSDTVNALKKSVGPMIDPFVYEARSTDRIAAGMLRHVQEDMIEVLALNKIRGGMTGIRAQQVAEKFQAVKGLADSSAFAVRVMADPELAIAEIGTLQADLLSAEKQEKEVMDPLIKQDLKKEIKLKKEKIEALEDWFDLFEKKSVTQIEKGEDGTPKKNEDGTEKVSVYTELGRFQGVLKEIKSTDADGKETVVKEYDQKDVSIRESFRKLMDIHNKETGAKKIQDSDIQQAFDLFVDYMNLDKDTKDYMNAVEVFSDQSKMLEIFNRMYSGKMKHQILGYLSDVQNIALKARIVVMQDGLSSAKDQFVIMQDAVKVGDFIIEEAQKLSSYQKLQAIANSTDTEHNLSDWAYITKQVDELKEELKKIVNLSKSQISTVAETTPVSVTPEAATASVESAPVDSTPIAQAEVPVVIPEVIPVEKSSDPIAPNVVTPDAKPSVKELSDLQKRRSEFGTSYGLKYGHQALWNRSEKKFYFFNKNGKLVTRHTQIQRMSKELANMRGMAATWWNGLLDEKERDEALEIHIRIMDFIETMGPETVVTEKEVIMRMIQGVKFTPLIVGKNSTDINLKKWILDKRDGGVSLDTYAMEVIADALRENGFGVMDEQDIINDVLEVIAMFPNGITKKDVADEVRMNSNLQQLEQEEIVFLTRFGLDHSIIYEKLPDPFTEKIERTRNEYEQRKEELPGTTEQASGLDTEPEISEVEEIRGSDERSSTGIETSATEDGSLVTDRSSGISELLNRKPKVQFSAEQVSETQAVVTDELGSSIGKEIALEEAEAKANELNTSLENTEFSKKFLGDTFSSDEKMVNAFVEAGNKAMKEHASTSKTGIVFSNLEEFSKIASGKRVLAKIKAEMLGLDQQKEAVATDGTGVVNFNTDFDLSSPASKMHINPAELNILHSEVLQIIEKAKEALQNPEKSGKFVEKAFSEKDQIERQAVDLLDMISKCTK
jgi:hypothetical protein